MALETRLEGPRPTPTQLVGIGFAMFWVSILAHEAGHFGVAAIGYSTVHVAELPAQAELSVVSAGALVTLTILAASGLVVGVAAHRGDVMLRFWISLAIGAASRIVFVGPGTLIGTALNDERTIGGLLGMSAGLLWAAEAGFAALILSWLIRQLPRLTRWRTVAWILIGASIGWGSALTFGRYIGLPI